MSAVVGVEKRLWLPVAAAALVAAMATLVVAGARLDESTSHFHSNRAIVEQPAWKVRVSSAAASGGATRPQRTVETQGGRISSVVTDVYDALLLDPSAVPNVLRERFGRSAARSLEKNGVGWPATATDIRIVRRHARIAIDPETPRLAVATVDARATALVENTQTPLRHRATLWLERGSSGWRIVAYDFRQKGPR